jgi:hypothetical protein
VSLTPDVTHHFVAHVVINRPLENTRTASTRAITYNGEPK